MADTSAFFRETTVHGFKYVAEGRTSLERYLWVLAIAVSFALAAVMLTAHFRDVNENPISTSITTVPIQDVPFPAVTLSAAHIPHGNRLIENVLNRIPFDCAASKSDCKTDEQARTDFAIHIERLVSSTLYKLERKLKEDVKENLSGDVKGLPPNHYLTNYLCSRAHYDSDTYGYFHPLLLASVHSNMTKVTRSGLIKAMAGVFRRPNPVVIAAVKTFLMANFPEADYDFVENCRPRLAEGQMYSLDDIIFAAATLKASGIKDSKPKLGLGQALTKMSSRQLRVEFDRGSKIMRGIMQHQMGTANIPYGFVYKYLMGKTVNDFEYKFKTRYLDICKSNSTWCDQGYELTRLMHLTLGLAKYAVAPPTRKLPRSEVEDVADAWNTLNYSKLEDVENVNTKPVVVACKFGNQPLSNDCNLFSNSFTTSGIGYTFNSEPFLAMYKNTTGNRVFNEEFHDADLESRESPRKIIGTGQDFSLVFYVSHEPYQDFPYSNSYSRTILMKIHPPAAVPDLKNSDLELKPGMFYDISVSPSMISTDAKGLELNPMKRGCLSPDNDESESSILAKYSQSGCFLECKLKKALDSCKCSAWDYPFIDGSAFCRSNVTFTCFDKIMHEVADLQDCDCPPDCNTTEFALTPLVTPITDCFGGIVKFETLIGSFPNSRYFDDDVSAISHPILAPCKKRLSKLSIVRVKISSSTANVVIKTKRVTFSDQLANLGGILGLFSGMSILSLVEVAFWSLRGLSVLCYGKGRMLRASRSTCGIKETEVKKKVAVKPFV